ncbi:hypothetical protein C8F01DRAFT_1376502 [Mycena amicta]|nr:hypothetical protein C8F01DRAFT_1376502 [Mycena amicta]
MSLCTRLVTHSHLGLHFPAAAVLYIDIDIDTHRGDGVEEVFYTTDRASFQIRRVLFRGRALRRTCIPAGHGASNRPTTIVLQCGADSLSGENLKLGDFNLSLSGHAVCVQFIRKCNLPLVFLGGGGVCYVYTVKNGGRTSPGPYLPSVWTLENDIREEAMACWIGFGNVRAPAFGTVRAPIELHFRGGMTGRQGTSWMRSRRVSGFSLPPLPFFSHFNPHPTTACPSPSSPSIFRVPTSSFPPPFRFLFTLAIASIGDSLHLPSPWSTYISVSPAASSRTKLSPTSRPSSRSKVALPVALLA